MKFSFKKPPDFVYRAELKTNQYGKKAVAQLQDTKASSVANENIKG